MISKDKFVEIINDLQKLDEQQDELCDVMNKLSPDFTVYFYPTSKAIGIVIELLSDMFGLDPLDSIIDYYAYELDWGKKGDVMGIYEDNHKAYHLTNAEKLYDYIIESSK